MLNYESILCAHILNSQNKETTACKLTSKCAVHKWVVDLLLAGLMSMNLKSLINIIGMAVKFATWVLLLILLAYFGLLIMDAYK